MRRIFALCITGCALASGALRAQTPPPPGPAPAKAADSNGDLAVQLTSIRRVFVDTLDGGQAALKIRDLLISSLQQSGVFIVTEDEARADAFLRGAAEDNSFISTFSASDRTNGRGQLGLPLGGGGSRYSNRITTGESASGSESVHSDERKHEAMASLRLVTKGGDVIWSTTQESSGGKFRGAAADVADRVANKLKADLGRAKRPPPAAAGPPPAGIN